MKLKVLPPTLRKNSRYLTVNILSDNVIDKDELVNIIWDGCIRFYGECRTADFDLWVMRFFEGDFNGNYKAIIRCQKGFENDVRAALSCINKYKSKHIAISTIGLSGTIKSSISKFIK